MKARHDERMLGEQNIARIPDGTKLLDRKDVHRGHLLLVNADHPVRTTEEPPLTLVAETGIRVLDEVIALETACMQQLAALLEAAEAGDDIVVVSGYRSMEEQTNIYTRSLEDNGPAYTAKYVALPGRSEHQTGLAVDVGERSEGELDFIAPSFPDRGKCLAFKLLAASYGFIQRYKEGKEGLTGIACEPWHFRYVGAPHAATMERLGFCLEEYIDYVKSYSYEGERLTHEGEGWRAETYYVPAEPQGRTAVWIPACDDYSLSGNNADGFIMTAYHGAGYVF
ncbi:D-alanyl-D-alanine carboxypeptidase family protein [Paenibacillus sp. LHD-117]|uniref:D-alanyl-D-alanine carboxypeptidase family protein n=1 Tax=Paenibacillus sp. LHD-117 TaxID=3071412 RepID=UPI0027E14A11|nr:D-alanyl-D-alanine carboxypeptidase family protein [Paenibacillus sp. LHD-117]MDQ6420979.1 D-alanyl-D-alanine carboxypeptidase family protein [Paenibacillus sp. LHD-117]